MSLINFSGTPEYLFSDIEKKPSESSEAEEMSSELSQETMSLEEQSYGPPHDLWSVDDLLINIFRHLKFKDMTRLSLTCTRFARICTSEVMWKLVRLQGHFEPRINCIKESFKHNGMEILKNVIQRRTTPANKPHAAVMINFLDKIFYKKIENVKVINKSLESHTSGFKMHLQKSLRFETSCGPLHFPAYFEFIVTTSPISSMVVSISPEKARFLQNSAFGNIFKTLRKIEVNPSGFAIYTTDVLCVWFGCGNFLQCPHINASADAIIPFKEINVIGLDS